MSKSSAFRSALRRSLSAPPPENAPAVCRPAHRSFTATADFVDGRIPSSVAIDSLAASATWSSKMIAWQAHSYGAVDDLVLTSNARSPVIEGSRDVVVRVKASSVNPLDVLMAGEYTSARHGTRLYFTSEPFDLQRVLARFCWAPCVKRASCPCTNPWNSP